jgi:hypothetical protein
MKRVELILQGRYLYVITDVGLKEFSHRDMLPHEAIQFIEDYFGINYREEDPRDKDPTW